MVKSERINISPETKNGLSQFAKPFESVDDCLKRIIQCDCLKDEMKKQVEHPDTDAETDKND